MVAEDALPASEAREKQPQGRRALENNTKDKCTIHRG